MKRYILFESSTGYAIFKVLSHEEIGVLLPIVQESISQLDKFGKVTKLIAYAPFNTASTTLENALSVTNGVMHDDLRDFLLANVKISKKVLLGLSDTKLASDIHEKTKINCESNEMIFEITRGIRTHFHKFIQDLNIKAFTNSQLGLGHSLSRSHVKFNVNKSDNMIIQSISTIDQLDKDINTFSMRIREWYSYHFPELFKIVKDNYLFAKSVSFIGDRNELDESKLDQLSDILNDKEMALEIHSAAKTSIGMDISEFDLINIEQFTDRIIELSEYRKDLYQYLVNKMESMAPNLTSVIGEIVGAKLISQAGSLVNLAKCPASTIQILGAEKALFRALKTKGNTPKYGLIYHSSFIGRSSSKYKGRVSRFLAHKCAIASRIDCFSDVSTNIIGKRLHEQIDQRVKFYQGNETSSKLPIKNIDCMEVALSDLKNYMETITPEEEVKSDCAMKTKKRKKKVKTQQNDSSLVEFEQLSINKDANLCKKRKNKA